MSEYEKQNEKKDVNQSGSQNKNPADKNRQPANPASDADKEASPE